MNVISRNAKALAYYYGSCGKHIPSCRNASVYKSSIALENLYPGCNLKLTTPTEPSTSMNEKFSGFIPLDQVDITYSRSTGPGGQNVNKVNTKVDLRMHLESATWLHEDIRTRLAEIHKTRISKEGYLIFRSDLTRSQQLNLADCLEKLRSAIRTACVEKPQPTIETAERIRRRQEKISRERLLLKREHSITKASRQTPNVRDL